MKKVCIITSVHSPLDVRIFYRQALTLRSVGYDVTLIAPGEKDRIVEDVKIITFQPAVTRIRRLNNHSLIFKLARQTQSDIYHIHDPDLLFLGLKLIRKLKVPVIYDSHEDYPLSVVSDKYYIPKPFRHMIALFTDIAEKYMSRKMTGVIAVYQHRLEKISHAGQSRMILPNYPPIARFKKVNVSEKNLKRMVYLGSLSEARGQYLLLELMTILKNLDKEIELEIIGFFDNETIERQFIDTITEHKLDNIQYHGRVPFENVPKMMKHIGIGIVSWLPTRQHLHAANPTKMFEYMASSMLVIAPKYGIFRDVLEKSDSGVLFEVENIPDLAKKIVSAVNNKEETMDKMSNARVLFEQKYNWDSIATIFLNFYKEIFNKNAEN